MTILERLNRRTWILCFASIILPIVIMLVAYYPLDVFFKNHYDDSYITYRYAINWANGNGLVFNVGEKTDSASSFTYALVLGVLYELGFENLEVVSVLISFFAFGIVLFIIFNMANKLTNSAAIALIVTVLFGLNGFYSGWVYSGMETTFWSATVLLPIYLMFKRANHSLILATIAVACFTRFEGILLLGSYFVYLLTQFLESSGSGKSFNGMTNFIVSFIKANSKSFLGIFGVIAALIIFYVIKFNYYGVWISHALLMKKHARYYLPDPIELLVHWRNFGLVAFILSIPAFLNRKHINVVAYFFLGFTVVLFGPRSDWGRYSIHLLPLVYIFAAVALSWILYRSRLVFGIVLIALASQTSAGFYYNHRNMKNLASHAICRRELGEFITQKLPNEKYIASGDIGVIAYNALGTSFVDVGGLTSHDVIQSYIDGKNINHLIRQKEVKYIADTFEKSGINRFESVQAGFSVIKEKVNYFANAIDPQYIYKCSLDIPNFDLFFAVAPIIEIGQKPSSQDEIK